MAISRIPRRAGLLAAGVTIALVAGAGGAAAGVAYLKLGLSNTSNVTTTLTGATTGAELSVRNTKDHPALALTVPAGVPPLRVNSNGNVANLNADLLDGVDSPSLARGKGVKTVATRRVVPSGISFGALLRIPGQGQLFMDCASGTPYAYISWRNDMPYPIDYWSDYPEGTMRGGIMEPSSAYTITTSFTGATRIQRGTILRLGYGNDGMTRRVADISLSAFRSGTDQPCGFDVVATTWSSE